MTPSTNSILAPKPPSASKSSRNHKRSECYSIACTSKRNQTPVSTTTPLNDHAGNWNACQTAETDDSVASSVVSAVVARLAELPNADWCQGDIGAGCEAEDDRKAENFVNEDREEDAWK